MYDRIRDLREDKDLTQKELSTIIDIHVNQYQKYERGEREIPVKLLIKLSYFYNVSTDYILGLTNRKERLK